ncbi:MAG: hypothetical protein H8D23_05700 [Candidatus Brocadiales bacterium]|nr:hypothetical protein [Candidatus Brocadiales bacterium]
MEELICNPHKGRLETINVEYNDANTTWFDNCSRAEDIYRLTDIQSGLLIKENNYNYPVLIYDLTRAGINYDPQEAKRLRNMHMEA